jgi:hypothetical protein
MRKRQAQLLDELVGKVYHVDLPQCRDFGEFQNRVEFMVRNLAEISNSLGHGFAKQGFAKQGFAKQGFTKQGFATQDARRIRRAAERVKVKAERLLSLCGTVPVSFAAPEEWRTVAGNLTVNYDILRFDAGHLYQLVIPESPFSVLRSAL